MINIDRHIEILLLDNDCVFVPGLGGFIAHYVEAQYDESTDSFFPPLRTLGFNAKLNINDYLLAQSYIESYDISYPEALRRIEDEVAELNDILREQGRVELNDLGVLFVNDEGNVEFEPCQAGILTPNLYGFDSLEGLALPETAIITTDKESTENDSNDIYIGGDAPMNENAAESEDDKEEPRLSIRLSTLRYIAASAASILLLFMVSQPLGNSQYTESAVDAGALYRLLPKDAKHTGNKATTDIILPKPTTKAPDVKKDVEAIVKAEPEEYTPKVVAPRYVIVLMSRIAQNNAITYASNLSKEGIAAEAVVRKNGSKVVCGNYADEDSARNALRALRSKDERFEDAWVMELK